MPSEMPGEEDDRETRSGRKRRGEGEEASSNADNGSNPMSNIFRKLKKNKTRSIDRDRAEEYHEFQTSHRASEKTVDTTRLLREMQRFGLEPSGLAKFITSLHKLAVASGVSPENLASIIKELSDLSEGKQLSLAQTRKHLQQLAERQKLLVKEVADLERKKGSLEVDVSLKGLEHSTTRETLSEFELIKKNLNEYNLSFTDVSRLVSLIEAAEKLGHDPSAVVNALSDLKSKEEEKQSLQAQIDTLLETKRAAQDKLLAIEDEVSEKQRTLKSAEELGKLGFDLKDLEELKAAIRLIAQTRNIEISAARNQLLSDLLAYYANAHELKKRIQIMEALLQEKEDKFRMLEADYQNEKAVLDNARKLISGGFDEQWVGKLRTIIDSYGTDIDALASELANRQGLKTSIDVLTRTKKALEEEERLLRQKVVAVEDQRLRTLSLINSMILKSPRSLISQKQNVIASTPEAEEAGPLRELLRAASGETVNDAEFRLSAQKAIHIICAELRKDSPARVILNHALLALKYEAEHKTG